jgi:hypothetical protein
MHEPRSQFTLALDMSGISQMVDVRVAVGFAPIVVLGFDGR